MNPQPTLNKYLVSLGKTSSNMNLIRGSCQYQLFHFSAHLPFSCRCMDISHVNFIKLKSSFSDGFYILDQATRSHNGASQAYIFIYFSASNFTSFQMSERSDICYCLPFHSCPPEWPVLSAMKFCFPKLLLKTWNCGMKMDLYGLTDRFNQQGIKDLQ